MGLQIHNITDQDLLEDDEDDSEPEPTPSTSHQSAETDAAMALTALQNPPPVKKIVPKFKQTVRTSGLTKGKKNTCTGVPTFWTVKIIVFVSALQI